MHIIDLQDVIRHYSPGNGRHWFDPGTLRYFSCRLPTQAYQTADASRAYFVTSEKPPRGNRAYSVRCYSFADRTIATVGGFRAYGSRSGADGAARRAASQDSAP